MSRLSHRRLESLPLHIVLRGIDGMPVFRQDADFNFFKSTLLDDCTHHGLAIHAYVLMENHVHLLGTPRLSASARKAMQSLGKRYLHYFNRRYERSGSLWDGSYRSSMIEKSDALIECMRYIDLHPVRLGVAQDPSTYAWSSYRANAQCGKDMLVTPHERYRALGTDPVARCLRYRTVAAEPLGVEVVERIGRGVGG